MPNIGNAWQLAAALAVTNPNALVPVRAWLRGWAAGLDTLAASAGFPRPASIPAPQTWDTSAASTADEVTGLSDAMRAIDAWESWYAPIARDHDLPPSTLIGDTPDSDPDATWSVIRSRVLAQPWAAYLTAEASRWRDALSAAPQLPDAARDRMIGAEKAVRQWWTARAARPFASRQLPPPQRPPAPRPSSNGGLVFGAILAALGIGLATRRRRR